MPVLLVSLGTSWAVVPEAFHFLPPGPAGFGAVHVLTSSSPRVEPGIAAARAWFAQRFPSVRFTVTRVAGFEDLRSEEDHFLFEEILFRWLLARAPEPAGRFVCLAGGFKVMSSAVQRAAHLFGAAELFHVLADPLYPGGPAGRPREASSPEEIDDSLARGAIRHLRLGAELGWPQLRQLRSAAYPLEEHSSDGTLCTATAPDQGLRACVAAALDRAQAVARHWENLADLPFSELATWPESDLAWLQGAVSPADTNWIARLPKLELHCHLGGFATHGETLAAVRAAAADPARLPPLRECPPPAGWPLPPVPCGLEPYRKLGDNNGSALLRDPGCLRAQCERLFAHFLEQNILYAEVRCSPANYITPGRSPFAVLSEIRDTFQRCMEVSRPTPGHPPRCHVNLLIIATRQDRGDFRTAISRHLTLAVTAAEHWTGDTSCRVVGVDLAGYEDRETRAHFFRDDFKAAHRCGLALTVHAGENDDAEGIWSAVLDLNARRLGHALSLGESPDLRRVVADRAIAVEMCPYANLQIKGYPTDDAVASARPTARYPLLDYLRARIRVTVNTDNLGISAASLTDNLVLVARLCPGLTRMDLLQLQRNALDAAFISPTFRAHLLSHLSAGLVRP